MLNIGKEILRLRDQLFKAVLGKDFSTIFRKFSTSSSPATHTTISSFPFFHGFHRVSIITAFFLREYIIDKEHKNYMKVEYMHATNCTAIPFPQLLPSFLPLPFTFFLLQSSHLTPEFPPYSLSSIFQFLPMLVSSRFP